MLVFTLNTCANKDIHLHQYETRVYDFWPQLLLLHSCRQFCFRNTVFNTGKSSSSLLTHKVCKRHLWDVRPYALSLVFLFPGLFL